MSRSLPVLLTFALAGWGVACGDSRLPPGVLDSGDAADGGDVAVHGGDTAGEGGDTADHAGDAAADAGGSDVAAEVGGGGATKRSAGCGASPDQALGKFVQHAEVISGVAPAYAATATNRVYWLRLPLQYDPARAYPLVLIGPGCGASGQASIPVQEASMNDAILVGMNGVDNCFNHAAVDTPDLPYFDATLAAVEASSCVDTSRVFVMGYSSGSWLTSYLGCSRGEIIRAQASVAGGLPPIPPTCTGPIPAMYVYDTEDLSNANVRPALNRVLAANGCGTQTQPYDIGVASPCVQYQGCTPGFPVVYCETTGFGHSDQSDTKISTIGFWHFFTDVSRSR